MKNTNMIPTSELFGEWVTKEKLGVQEFKVGDQKMFELIMLAVNLDTGDTEIVSEFLSSEEEVFGYELGGRIYGGTR